MARKKKTTSEEGNSLVGKPKGLFDHINHIREVQSPTYIKSLGEQDLKSWSNFMICRFLSMDQNTIEMVNEIQKYGGKLKPTEFYKLATFITPKRRAFFPYIKSSVKLPWEKEVIDLLRQYFQESEDHVIEYIEMMSEEEIVSILKMYGMSDKEIKQMKVKI